MAETFKSAMRGYAPVTVLLMGADLLLAGYLVLDTPMPPGVPRLALFGFSVAVLWTMTLLIACVFAGKEVWLSRRLADREAEREWAEEKRHAEARWRQQHADDLLNCPGPCRNRYGCMVGMCVQAALIRSAIAANSPDGNAKRLGGR